MSKTEDQLRDINDSLQYIVGSFPDTGRIEKLLEKILKELEAIKNKLPV